MHLPPEAVTIATLRARIAALDEKPLIPPTRAQQLLAEAKARKPWPPETPCYKCGGPVGQPFTRLTTSRPVCPACAWANIERALFSDDAKPGGES
jgi:hypothetical protein